MLKILKEILANQEKLIAKMEKLTNVVSHIPTTHHTDLGDWLNEEQAQELLHLGTTSMWKLRKKKIIVSKKLGGKNYYSKKSIIDYLQNQ